MKNIVFSLFCLLLILSCLNGCSLSRKDYPGFSQLIPIRNDLDGCEQRNTMSTSTKNYRIRTNLNSDEVFVIGQFMESALVLYQNLTGSKFGTFQGLNINIYCDRKTYENNLSELKLVGGASMGFYSPVPPAAIHVLWTGPFSDHPFLTLAHEGFHQFAHHTALADKQLNPAENRLNFPVAIPIWLNEGLAQFVEGAVVTEKHFEPGRIHQARLVHLQNLIKTKKVPDLKKILNQRYDEPFDNADYSASWGVVFALYHGLSSSGKWYTDSCLINFQGIFRDFLSANFLNDYSEHGWDEFLARESLLAFEQSVLKQGYTLSDWEKAWHFAMLSLDPNLPYGGLEIELN